LIQLLVAYTGWGWVSRVIAHQVSQL